LGLDRGTHLGQRSWSRVNKAGHICAIDPLVRLLNFALASKGRPHMTLAMTRRVDSGDLRF
jgi:hypothetical protein